MSANKKNVADLFKQGSSNLGLDDDATDAVVANLDATTLPMCVGAPIDENDSDDVTVVFFALDASPSMSPVEDELVDGFNTLIIPALKGAARQTVQSFRIGGLKFNSSIKSLWGAGFHKIEDLPALTKRDYSTGGGGTALYKAQIDALTATSIYASDIITKTGIAPRVIVVVLSDGANNCPPFDADEVKIVASKLSTEIFTLIFAMYHTDETVDAQEIARETGFGKIFEMQIQPGEDLDDKKKRFRRLLGVISSSIIQTSQKPTISSI